jgi:hypothetical protein
MYLFEHLGDAFIRSFGIYFIKACEVHPSLQHLGLGPLDFHIKHSPICIRCMHAYTDFSDAKF